MASGVGRRRKTSRSRTPRRGQVSVGRGGRGRASSPSVRGRGQHRGRGNVRATSLPRLQLLRRPAAAAAAGRRRSSASRAGDAEDDEEERTDDEDSDDEDREQFEERLLQEEENEASVLASLDEKASQAPHLLEDIRAVPYQLVIPTYGRWRPVKEMSNKRRYRNCKTPFILKHTLGFLSRQQVARRRVTLFVASKEELERYRAALRGSEWANVRIEISVLGNMNSRNFIYKHFAAGTYVVSIDDDVEHIAWKFREGITHHVLRILPPGSFEKLIFHAYRQMKEKKAFLWGVNTSQNPRHMRSWGMSVRNGLVNGYLNGFICRPHLANQLLRTLTDATEDSEFSVRHYAKDGVVLRYRMYAGITSPYLNRGGLQTKFERKGERITADERGTARKTEERWGASELNKLFPRLVGPPRKRRDKKTMEVDFYPLGYPPGEGQLRRMIAPRLRDEDQIEYKENPKIVGTTSWQLYESYKAATTVAEARSLGARPIDFAFDSNWGYLTLVRLSTKPLSRECEVLTDRQDTRSKVEAAVASSGKSKLVMVRAKEMSEGHKGLGLPRRELALLAKRCPALRKVKEEEWAASDGPLASLPMEVLRVLLNWASKSRLLYARSSTKAIHDALKALGCRGTARNVKQLEVQELAAERKLAAKTSAKGRLRPSRPQGGGPKRSSNIRRSKSRVSRPTLGKFAKKSKKLQKQQRRRG